MFGLFGGAPKLSVSDVKDGLKNGTMILVDARDAQELHVSGMAKGAIHVALPTIRMKCDPRSPDCLPEFKDTKITKVLYCASGARSAGAMSTLKQLGHEDVKNLGGLHNWASGGGELVNI